MDGHGVVDASQDLGQHTCDNNKYCIAMIPLTMLAMKVRFENVLTATMRGRDHDCKKNHIETILEIKMSTSCLMDNVSQRRSITVMNGDLELKRTTAGLYKSKLFMMNKKNYRYASFPAYLVGQFPAG